MHWISIIWAMVASLYFTLSFIHFMIWLRFRARRYHFYFSIAALGAGGMAIFELLMMHAATTHAYGELIRWAHIPVLLLSFGVAAFATSYFHPKRAWIGSLSVLLRILAVIVNFLATTNLIYLSVDRLLPFSAWGGETLVAAHGIRNPAIVCNQVSDLMLLIFLADVSVTVWRRGEIRRALMIGGALFLFVLIAAGTSFMHHMGIAVIPYLISFPLLPFILAMGYELSLDLFREAQLVEKVQARELELQESERRLELAATAAELALWVWEVEKDEIWMTPGGRAFFGFGTDDKLTLERFVAAVHPDFQERFRQGILGARRGVGNYEIEFQLHVSGQAPRWIAGRGRMEFNELGAPVRMRGVSLDITKRKETERELHRQREELVHLSRVSTLGELSGSLAHELNQPLTSILSNSQAGQRFLESGTVDVNELKEILKDVVEQGKRAGEVIQRIRMLLRKGEVQFVSLDIAEVIREVLLLMRSDLIGHGVVIRMEFAKSIPPVRGDRVQLQQVLLNLVMNACDAMNGSSPKRLTVATAGHDEGSVRVSISDVGKGISPGRLDDIFEPFFTTKEQGMGLGLSLCRTIIQVHGGRIWAENGPNRGATFYFTLPLADGK